MKLLDDAELTERDKKLLALGDGTYICPVRMPDGGLSCVMRRGYNWTIICDLDDGGYADLWCYHHQVDAVIALLTWSGEDGTEPEGWFRNPTRGRRREGGDANKEYVHF